MARMRLNWVPGPSMSYVGGLATPCHRVQSSRQGLERECRHLPVGGASPACNTSTEWRPQAPLAGDADALWLPSRSRKDLDSSRESRSHRDRAECHDATYGRSELHEHEHERADRRLSMFTAVHSLPEASSGALSEL
eukprot:scaffold1646_cov52-Phaeocystis_antarctica.AAC.1